MLAQPLSIVRQGFDVVAVKIILELLPGDSVLADSHQEVVVSLAVYYTILLTARYSFARSLLNMRQKN